MNPLEAFTTLLKQNLPLVLSFPVEEERGHIITGKGICYIEKIEAASRVTLGRFSPFGAFRTIGAQAVLHVTYEIEGTTYGCVIRDVACEGGSISATIPDEAQSSLRKFVRVEPSSAAPVILYLHSDEAGTLMLRVRDISEHGMGLLIPDDLNLEKNLLCGVGLPFDGGAFLLLRASVVYKMEVGKGPRPAGRPSAASGFAYGLEISPHPEDLKKIRLYVMQRELEISEKIQAGW